MKDNSIIIRLAKDSDQDHWDEYVLRHSDASPYHLFAWKRAIEKAYGHQCDYLYAEKDNWIIGVLPLTRLCLSPIINEIVSLPFCDVGNCIAESEDVQTLLLNSAIGLKEKTKARRIQFRGRLHQADDASPSLLRPLQTAKVRMLLNLPPSPDELFSSFPSKLRSQIRKAEKNGVIFRWGGLDDFNAAYHVFAKNMHELGSPVHSKLFLKAVHSYYGARAKLGITEFDGEMIGMGIILTGNRGVSIPWASTLREYNRLAPNMMLYWNFLKYSADNGYAFFDFGRSTEGEGTYNFKKQWGAKPTPLVWYEYVGNGSDAATSESTGSGKREFVATMWQKLPLGVANMVGPHLRKYISL